MTDVLPEQRSLYATYQENKIKILLLHHDYNTLKVKLSANILYTNAIHPEVGKTKP